MNSAIVKAKHLVCLLVDDCLCIGIGLSAISILIILFEDILFKGGVFDVIDVDAVFSILGSSLLFTQPAATVL